MRPSILLSFWRIHKGRRRVEHILRWFMDRAEAQGRGRAYWEHPSALGFLATVITRLAQGAAGPLDADALAALQCESWAALTGLSPEPFGERLVLLSAEADPAFLDGCRRGLAFAEALAVARHAPDRSGAQRDLADLWDMLLAELPPGGLLSGIS